MISRLSVRVWLCLPVGVRPWLVFVLCSILAACGMGVIIPGVAYADGCSNEQIRELQGSTFLPECRVYEMVSPPYKADYGVESPRAVASLAESIAALDGERYIFTSLGAFASTGTNYIAEEYIARRGAGGWESSSVFVPAAGGRFANGAEFNLELTKQVIKVDLAQNEGHNSTSVTALFVNDLSVPGSPFVRAFPLSGPPSLPGEGEMIGASTDLSRVVLNGNFFHETVGEVTGVGSPSPEPWTVGEGGLGGGSFAGASTFHAVSADGSEVFFTEGRSPGGPSFVRLNGAKTLSLGGNFQGASEDGSKAFFYNAGHELYMDKIGCKPEGSTCEPQLREVTKPVQIAGGFALVVRISDDGSHVYFVSPNVLTAGKNVEGHEPVEGASNLYAYDTVTRETAFVAVTGVEGLPGNAETQAQVNGCQSHEEGCEAGRFLVFVTKARLTPDDTDTAADVYEYDASTGRLVRVSAGEDGYDNNGNNSAFNASIAVPSDRPDVSNVYELGSRAVSDAGTVVFTTAEPLSPRAVNGQPDIYEWHEGRVGLISSGHSLTPDEVPVITPSGRDIFFLTSEGLLPQDTDGLLDVYDARIGGGFPAAPVSAGGCSGDDCQGPPSVPSLLGAPASATFSGLGNPTAAVPTPAVTPKSTSKPPACRKGYTKRRGKCVKKRKAKKASNKRRAK
jgi:hypothetical protein